MKSQKIICFIQKKWTLVFRYFLFCFYCTPYFAYLKNLLLTSIWYCKLSKITTEVTNTSKQSVMSKTLGMINDVTKMWSNWWCHKLWYYSLFKNKSWAYFFSLSSQEFNRLFLRHLVNSNLIHLVVLWQVHYFVLK